ncbi:type I fatty acid synthase [Cryptosporidium bovis]|uniref:type I fatty acid synthase n=1 Tax=Cryptosporidium bovis TaxID=310047 RepID=UPI003519F20B|nr:type I fatty acid synthase [Cryptosporidium bovis]
MAATLKQHLEKVGMHGITNELGIRLLNDILCFITANDAVIGCQSLKWETFMRRYNSVPKFLSEVDYSSQIRSQGHVDINKLSDEELVVMIAQIAQQCASSSTLPGPDTVLLDLGLDSLGAVEFRNSVLDMTGVKLPQTLVFENPTISAIATYVRGQKADGGSLSTSNINQQSIEQTNMTIEQWLISSLKQSERYILYVDSFEKRYLTMNGLILETDIMTALEDMGVENNEDFDLLYVSWSELISTEENNKKNENLIEDGIKESAFDPIEDLEEVKKSLKLNLDGVLPEKDPSEFKLALLTGVTGFVGRILLIKLAEQFKDMKIVCLVRAKNEEVALQRIINVCEEAEVWDQSLVSRIVVECGDFEKEYLGLSKKRYEELSLEVDVVYHIGGDVNLLSNYKRLRKTNTLSLIGIIDFCCRGRLKHLHFSSTLGQFPAFFSMFTREFENYVVTETECPSTKEMSRLFPPTRQGYPWSKWAAEQILEIARDQGLRVSIYRLPNTYIASNTGYTNKTDYATALLISSITEKMFPIGSSTAPLTPVNTICDIIIAASKKKMRKHWRYNLIDTRVINTSDFELWGSQLGIKEYKGVLIDEFFTVIKNRGPESPIFKFVPLMKYWRHYWFDNVQRTTPFPVDTSHVLEDFPEIKWPRLEDTFYNSFLYCVKRGYFPANSASVSFIPAVCFDDALDDIQNECAHTENEFNKNKYDMICSGMQRNVQTLHDILQELPLTFFAKYSYYQLLKQSIINQYMVQTIEIEVLERMNLRKCYFVTGTTYEEISQIRNSIKNIIPNITELKSIDVACPYIPRGNSREFILKLIKMATSTSFQSYRYVINEDSEEVLSDDSILLEMLLIAPFGLSILYGTQVFERYKEIFTSNSSEVIKSYSMFKNYVIQTLVKYNYNIENPILFSSPFHLAFISEILQVFKDCKNKVRR